MHALKLDSPVVQFPHTAPSAGVAERLVAEVSDLVSPPGVFVQLQELMRSPTASATDFGAIIARDPGLTAKLLRISNSAYFSLRARVDTVTRAVTVVGIRDIYSLALSVSAVTSFSGIGNGLVDMSTFWRHSILTATIARGLAKQMHVLHPERMFVAGILHDVGLLVLLHECPSQMEALLLKSEGDEAMLHAVESAALGCSHAEVGTALLAHWDLPPAIGNIVAGHHHAITAEPNRRETGLVALSEWLASSCGVGALAEGPSVELPELDDVLEAANCLGLGASEISSAVAEAVADFGETARLFTD